MKPCLLLIREPTTTAAARYMCGINEPHPLLDLFMNSTTGGGSLLLV